MQPDPETRSWLYNPGSHLFHAESGFDPGRGYTLDELSNGRYTISGHTIYQREGWNYISNVPTTREVRITEYPSGHLQLFVETPISDVNRRFYAKAGIAVGAEFSIDIGGIARHFELDYSIVAPPGRMLITAGGNEWSHDNYKWMNYGPGITPEVVATLNPGFRPATTQEAIEYMLRGLVWGKYKEYLQHLIDSGQAIINGQTFDTVSGLAAYIVESKAAEVSAARFTYLGRPV